ncbi:MAG: hypothetical protein CME65_03415 [Halobacteriovoraceae bacterium]|nr:hypothetical protein [Halobacteriovoraceae bacterium]
MKYFVLFLIQFQVFAHVSMEGIPSAQSLEEAKTSQIMIRERFIEHYLNEPIVAPPTPPKIGFAEFATTNLARLIAEQDLDLVTNNILDPSFGPWNPGTNFSLIGSLCKREGDYDFVLQILLKMAYIDFDRGETLLSEPARQKLWYDLLSQSGGNPYVYFDLPRCPINTRLDTENHILMTNIAKYLTNQLRSTREPLKDEYNNTKNGLKDWLLEHLSVFLREDFSELNSRGYEGYTQLTLAVLYDYAWDQELRTMAQMLLDYSYAKLAVQSIGMRRYGPFRRQRKVLKEDDLSFMDNTIKRGMVHTGNFDFLHLMGQPAQTLSGTDYQAFMAATESYKVPDMLVDLTVDKETPYWQTFENITVEMYYGSENFLLSAGGRFKNFTDDFGTGENDVLVVGTSIMPKDKEMKISSLIRFEDHPRNSQKRNICVYKNFACGFNLVIPDHIPESCSRKEGDFTFYDLKNCSTDYDFYLAVYNKRIRRSGSIAQDRALKNYGFFEVSEADRSFDSFVQNVLSNNQAHEYRREIRNGRTRAWRYKTTLGDTIDFSLDTPDAGTYPIAAINGQRVNRDTYSWNLAEGDIVNSLEEGLTSISHPKYEYEIILDARDPLNPKRVIQEKE